MRYFNKPEFKIPLVFLVISTLWIVISDRFFEPLQQNASIHHLVQIQTVKGVVYVTFVALLIYLMIKSSHNQLQASQEEYRDLFLHTPEPMIIYDPETRKVANVNKSATDMYGYSTQEFVQLTIYDLRANAGEKNNTEERTFQIHKKKNGQHLYCHETVRVIKMGAAKACLMTSHDITELEHAKGLLVHREVQLKQILNSITDGFFILDKNRRVVNANDVFKDMAEIPVDKVEGKTLSDLFPSLSERFTTEGCSEIMERSTSVYFELFYKRKKCWYRITAYPFEGGMSVFYRDITLQKQNELQSYQHEQNLLALINNTGDLIWSIDKAFRYFTFNEPYEHWYNKVFGEKLSIGRIALNERQGAEHIGKWRALYQRALNGEKFSVDMNFVIDDEFYFTTIRFNPILDADRKVTGVCCFLQNITERKLYERKIEQQNQKLKDIASITSHQVRVPLANILGLAEVLDNDDPMSSSNRQIIEHIKTSALQLDQAIINMVQQTIQAND